MAARGCDMIGRSCGQCLPETTYVVGSLQGGTGCSYDDKSTYSGCLSEEDFFRMTPFVLDLPQGHLAIEPS